MIYLLCLNEKKKTTWHFIRKLNVVCIEFLSLNFRSKTVIEVIAVINLVILLYHKI